jgi:HK97 family phage portal protein
MILRTATRHGFEVRTSEFGSTDPLRWRQQSSISTAGVAVTLDRFLGIPAVAQAIRLAAQNVAQLPATVYDETAGSGDSNRVEATTSWQYDLIRNPGPNLTRFNLMSDISSCVDGFGNAFVQKIKTKVKRRTQVVELQVIEPNRVRVKRLPNGDKVFDVIISPGRLPVRYDTSDIMHFRGFTPSGMMSGIDPLTQYKISLGNIMALQEFTGRYFANDGTPSGYLYLPPESDLDKQQLDEILEMWEEKHSGPDNWGKTAILQGGAEYRVQKNTMQDAQLLETRRFDVEDIARMINVPVELLQPSNADTNKTEEVLLKLLAIYIKPRVEIIKATFNEDVDTFWNTPYAIDFDFAPLKQADIQAQSIRDRWFRQAGILTANEVRAMYGFPPRDDGDELQQTPVGGEANAAQQTGDGTDTGGGGGTGGDGTGGGGTGD